jgi:hypothetical protein
MDAKPLWKTCKKISLYLIMATTTAPTNFIDILTKNVVTLSVAIYLIVIAYYMTKDPEKIFTKIYLYSTIAIVPIIIGFVYLLKNSNSNSIANTAKLELNDYIKYGFGFVFFILIVYFFNNINISSQMVYLATGFVQLIVVFMIIVAFAIIYKVGYNYLYKMQGLSGFIVNLIFYIPCMLLDLLEYLKADLQQAPKAVYVLLIIELVLGLLYVYSPIISKSFGKMLGLKDGKVVLAEPLRIDKETRLTSYVDLQENKIDDKNQIINNKFAISAWIYIVPVSPSHSPYNGDATIFEFTNYHPRLIYNGAKGKFKVFFNQSSSTEVDMPLQKWNHVVFNYTKLNADLFVNGKLIGSVKRDVVNENLSISDIMTVGQVGGLSGGICNIVYFPRPLVNYEIETIYSLNKDSDQPSI